jgi:hypothetical protein
VDVCASSSEETRQKKKQLEGRKLRSPGGWDLYPSIHKRLHFLMSVEGNSGLLGMGPKDNGGNEIKADMQDRDVSTSQPVTLLLISQLGCLTAAFAAGSRMRRKWRLPFGERGL